MAGIGEDSAEVMGFVALQKSSVGGWAGVPGYMTECHLLENSAVLLAVPS